jgi:hypothetical protein
MKSNKNIINDCSWISQLFKLFLLIILFYLFKRNIQLGLISSLIVLLIYYKYDTENFTGINDLPVDQMIESIDTNKLTYNKFYLPLDIDERVNKITKMALKDKKLKKIINSKMIDIYEKIQNNQDLKMYLKFVNLINNEGLPSFINESEEIVLSNQIKIILVTLPNSS